MKYRSLSIAATVVVASGLAVVGTTAAYAVTNVSPASTFISATSSNLSFSGALFSSTCTSTSFGLKTPASGLGPVNLVNALNVNTPPSITGCTHPPSAVDTITATGVWQIKWVSGSPNKVQIIIPANGVTFTSTGLPNCTITASPGSATTIQGTFAASKGVFSGASVGFSSVGTGCTGVGTSGTMSGTVTLSPTVTLV